MLKTCRKCQHPKERNAFHKTKKNKDGLHNFCKSCCKKINKQYGGIGSAQSLRAKQRYDKRIEYLRNIKRERGCKFCPEHEAVCLDFHHNGNKEFNLSKAGSRALAKLKAELDKCYVICANCHRKLHAGLLSVEILFQKDGLTTPAASSTIPEGTSAVKALGPANGTAPLISPADAIQLYFNEQNPL